MPKIIITLSDILNYVGTRERALKEGEAVFKAGHIILCGVDMLSNIKSLCLQTSVLASPPHEIEINLTRWLCKCTCKAGNSGYCKHVVATLIYVNRHEELDNISCTDITQTWGKEKKTISEKYANTEVCEYAHKPKTPKLDFTSNADIDKKNLNLLIACKPLSALGKFIDRSKLESRYITRNIEKENWTTLINGITASSFLKNFNFDLGTLNSCCRLIIEGLRDTEIVKSFLQRTTEWNKQRMLRITGSRYYEIFTFCKDEPNAWHEKSLKYFWPKGFHSKFTEYGNKYEKEARDSYANVCAVEVKTPQFIICPHFPWLAYSPDGVVYENNQPTTLLEIKCPFYGKTCSSSDFIKHCSYLLVENNTITLKKKHQYFAQVQMGMALLNLPRAHIILYSTFSKDFLKINIDFDADYTFHLLSTITKKYLYKMLHVYCINKHNY